MVHSTRNTVSGIYCVVHIVWYIVYGKQCRVHILWYIMYVHSVCYIEYGTKYGTHYMGHNV